MIKPASDREATLAATLLYKRYDAAWLAACIAAAGGKVGSSAINARWGWTSCAKTPTMVRTELWSCLLVYNLLRESLLHAAQHSGRACRSLSLTATLQLFGNLWLSNAIRGVDAGLRELFFEHQIAIKVGHRPDRNEPRATSGDPKSCNC